jgi:CheY-like chemotaxis protein
VRAEARVHGRLLELRVIDAGRGMHATPARARGRGVGLKVALELAELLGAELRHEPADPAGTIATVRVPLLQSMPGRGMPVAGALRPLAPRRAPRPARVLLVEDDLLLRRLVTARLTQAGHVVVQAADGRAALEPAGPFDVVLLDAHLGAEPVGDDLVVQLRARAHRLVAVTGDPSPRLRVDLVLRKPFDLDELVDLVDSLASVRPDAGAPLREPT